MKSNLVLLRGMTYMYQGEADNLCTFYAMSMLLAAMFPSLYADLVLHGISRRHPILKAFTNLPGNEDVSSWFFHGLALTRAWKIMNTIADKQLGAAGGGLFRNGTVRLKNRRGYKGVTLEHLFSSIDNGLPCLLGGAKKGVLATHAVVMIGYDRTDATIAYLDPAECSGTFTWQTANDVFVSPVDVVFPTRWAGPGAPPRPF